MQISWKRVPPVVLQAVLVAALAAPVGAQDASAPIPEAVRGELGRAIDALVARGATFGYSGQVLVEKDGEVVLHRAYGFADPAARRPLTPATAIGVASISKQFAAAAILALEEAGRLSVRDSLARFFPDVPKDKRGITIHQLLTHTAGVTTPLTEDFQATSRDQLVASITEAPLRFEPGTSWSYSVAGYNLVAAIVEIVSGLPYGEYLTRSLFEPAGMTRTHLLDATAPGEDVARAQLGWDDRGTPDEWPRNWRNFGAGDVMSTAADLLRWERALRAGTVLSPASVERMISPQAEVQEGVAYGYGWFLSGEPGTRMVEHGGDAALGYNASFYRYPDEGLVVLITSASRTANGEYTRHAFGQPIESLARGDTIAMPPTAELPGDAARPATFRGRGGARLHLVTDGVHAWLAADGQAAVDALLPPEPDDAPDLGRANERTAALVAGLQAGDSTAYPTALGPEGATYVEDFEGEWRGLVGSRGPLQRFRMLGSALGSATATTRAWLRFRDGAATMSFFWSERSAGPLVGTFVESLGYRPPVAVPLGRLPGGGWVAYDLISGASSGVRIEGGRLTLEGREGEWIEEQAAAGWTPPFRP